MKVGIYCRVSTEEQKKNETIESQLEELRQFAKDKGYEIVSEYFDDGWSGSILERPDLDRLRDDVKNGKMEAVLAHHPDRLSRVQLHQFLLFDEFDTRKVQLIFIKLPEFSEQSEESRIVNKSVWSMVSELERLRIRERTRRGRRFKAEIKGLVVGNIPPYGYSYVKKDKDSKTEGYYKVNPEEARVVKMLFEWARNGTSGRGVIRKLAELKIPRRNPPKDSRRPRWAWAKSTVHKILTNETYTGVTYYNKYESVEPENPLNKTRYKRRLKGSRKLRPRSEWIHIKLPVSLQFVSRDDFNFVQQQLIRNKVHSNRNTKRDYLLRGLVRCKECDSLYYASSSHGRPNYRCSNRAKRFPLPKTCSGSISTQIIEPLVWNSIREAVMNPNLILRQALRYEETTEAETSNWGEVNGLLSQLQKEEERVLEAYRQGVIEVEQLKDQIEKIKLRREVLTKQKEEEIKPISPQLLKNGLAWLCKEMGKTLDSISFVERRQFLRLLVDEIILGKRKVVIRGVLPVYEKIEPKLQITPTTFL